MILPDRGLPDLSSPETSSLQLGTGQRSLGKPGYSLCCTSESINKQ